MAAPLAARMITGLHSWWYTMTNGRIGGRFGKAPVLLLTTTGRKTAKERVTPLMYVRDGNVFALMASNGGRPTHPAWYLNLLASPDATVQLGAVKRRVHAEQATPEQSEQLWPRFVAIYKGYAGYREKTSRTIPIVLLKPPQPADPAGTA
jgi:deazaflavin-dependent oxidoreductase (nitroreductase family)